MKGVGRIYQQTFIDTCAKIAFAKLYDRKTPLTAADLLNDRVEPFYDQHEVRLCRVLTDRGTEYSETPSTTSTSSISRSRMWTTPEPRPRPQTNGIVERFHKTVLKPVLPGGVPQAHLRLDRRAARGSRRVDQELQRKQTPSGPLVFRQNPNADLP